MSYRTQRTSIIRDVVVYQDWRGTTVSEFPFLWEPVVFDQVSQRGNGRSPTPYSFSKLKATLVDGPNASIDKWIGSTYSRFGGLPYPNGYWVGSIPQRARDIVHNQCVEKFYGLARDSDLNSLVTLGEAPELAKMRSQVAALMQKAKGWRQKIKKVGSAHLFVAFGVRPLIADVQGYVNFVHNSVVKNGVTVRVRGSYSGSDTWYPQGTEHHKAFDRYSIRQEMKANLSVGQPEMYDAWRLGVTSAFSSLWELTTLSFLVDYFYSAGSYIQNVENSLLCGLNVSDGYVSVGSEMVTQHWVFEHSEGIRESRYVNMQGVITHRAFSRSLLSSVPFPRPPSLTVDLGSSQLLNCAALLSGLLRS